jgi:hypothetical protein
MKKIKEGSLLIKMFSILRIKPTKTKKISNIMKILKRKKKLNKQLLLIITIKIKMSSIN